MKQALAESLQPHSVTILELVEGDAKLMEKFDQAMAKTDEVVVWLPTSGKLNTVFGELMLLRKDTAWHGRHVWVFAEEGVLDVSSAQFKVLHPAGQIGFILDLPQVYRLHTFEYDTLDDASRLLKMYAAGSLG